MHLLFSCCLSSTLQALHQGFLVKSKIERECKYMGLTLVVCKVTATLNLLLSISLLAWMYEFEELSLEEL